MTESAISREFEHSASSATLRRDSMRARMYGARVARICRREHRQIHLLLAD
jgi:hypothetical protein